MLIQIFVVQVVTFLAIIFVLRKFLYAESVKEMKRLKKLREEGDVKQKELQEKIDQAQSLFDQKMADAEKGARSLRARSEAEAKEHRLKVLDKAKEDADNIMKAAFNAKEKMREEVVVEVMRKVPLFAARLFSAVLSEEIKELTHRELVKDVIERVKHLDGSTFKIHVDHGEIVSAYALPAADRAEIETAIRLGLGYEISWVENNDAAVAAGLVIKLGSIIIDGSLENRMRQAERELTGSLSTERERPE
jgi:F-type H+-transporting ATPase subunit b